MGRGEGGRVQRRLNSSDLISDTVSLRSQYGAWVSLLLGRFFWTWKSISILSGSHIQDKVTFFVGLNLKFCTFGEKEAEAVLSSNKFV